MNEYGALENQMDGMIRDIEELRAENETLKAENKKLKRNRVFIPKPIDFSGNGLLFALEGLKQLYNGEEVEKIVKERDRLKVELRDKVDYIHEQSEVIKDYKHRAEVAERALMYAVSEYRCDECPCAECNAEIRGSQECIELICEEYKKSAEREIEEEKDY